MGNDLITIITTTDGSPAGKTLSLVDGVLTKESSRVAFGTAITYHVPDIRALSQLISGVSATTNQAILLGGFEGIPVGETFNILPKMAYLERGKPDEVFYTDEQGVKNTARLKKNIIDSSYKMVDRDVPSDMPDCFANLSQDEWLANMNLIAPGFADCAKVISASSTGRVIVNGVQQYTNNFHIFIKVKDPGDWLRFRDAICANSYDAFLVYNWPTEEQPKWKVRYLFDRTTFSKERLVYECQPTVASMGLTITPADIKLIDGGVLDTSLVTAPEFERVGYYQSTGGPSGSGDDYEILDLDQLIDTKRHGVITVRAFRDDLSMGDETGKLRDCQCFNRVSYSWNAFLQRKNNGQIFYFDNGDDIGFKTVVDPSEQLAGIDIQMQELEPHCRDYEILLNSIDSLDTTNQRAVDAFIDDMFYGGLNELEQKHIVDILKEKIGDKRLVTRLVKKAKARYVAAVAQSVNTKNFEASQQVVNANGGCLPLKTEIDKASFPDTVPVTADGVIVDIEVKTTIDNTRHVVNTYGIAVAYDQIRKRPIIQHGEFSTEMDADNVAEACLNFIINQFDFNMLKGYNPTKIMGHLDAITVTNQYNPVTSYMRSLQWDGDDRLGMFCDLIGVAPRYEKLKKLVVGLWLIQCVAAADGAENTPLADDDLDDPAIPKYEHVLVFQSKQGFKKTKFFRHLVPVALRRYFADGVILNPDNKDSVINYASSWIVELGELDATFNRGDIATLKGHLSKQVDRLRKPYGKTYDDFKRRTSPCGSVNSTQFLFDSTGNRRFWVLPVTSLTLPSPSVIDLDQLWAQVWHLYLSGEKWWTSYEEQKYIENFTAEFAGYSKEQRRILSMLLAEYEQYGGFAHVPRDANHFVSTKVIAETIGLDTGDHISLGGVLKKLNKDANGVPRNHKGSNGVRGWYMPKDGDGLQRQLDAVAKSMQNICVPSYITVESTHD